jgi:hypothetical protein
LPTLERTNQKIGARRVIQKQRLNNGRTRFSRSRGRHTLARDSNTSIVKKKTAVFLPKAKRAKSALVISIGRLQLSATSCTRPVGAWQSYSRKFCNRVLFQIIRQTREAPRKHNTSLLEPFRVFSGRDHAAEVASRSHTIFISS